ncbi:MAG TPA: hypothetical protein VFX19_08160, partial [Dehalococcoidia bacterium]|nr:hypothetical protein [Dehalococcoidia bacterium]
VKESAGGGGVVTFETSSSLSPWKYFYEGLEERQPVFVLNAAVRDVAKIVRCAQSRSADPVADV